MVLLSDVFSIKGWTVSEKGKKMREKVVKLGVKREPGFLYFLRGDELWKVPMKRAGGPSTAGKASKVASTGIKRDSNYLYFLDQSNDISRSKRAVGGQKRKKTAKPIATKKAPAKKTAAKPVAKKAPAKKVVAKKKK